MSGFEIFLDIVVITVGFLLVGRDRNAAPQPAPQQQDDAPHTEPPIDAEAVLREAIATMPKSLVAGSVSLAEVLTFPSREPAPVVAEVPAKRKRGRPKGSGKKKLAPALAG